MGWGFAPDPTGELTALPRHPSWFRGWGPEEREGGRGKGGRGGEVRGGSPGMSKSIVGKPTVLTYSRSNFGINLKSGLEVTLTKTYKRSIR